MFVLKFLFKKIFSFLKEVYLCRRKIFNAEAEKRIE